MLSIISCMKVKALCFARESTQYSMWNRSPVGSFMYETEISFIVYPTESTKAPAVAVAVQYVDFEKWD